MGGGPMAIPFWSRHVHLLKESQSQGPGHHSHERLIRHGRPSRPAIENGPVEIVDLPINSMMIFHSYVDIVYIYIYI